MPHGKACGFNTLVALLCLDLIWARLLGGVVEIFSAKIICLLSLSAWSHVYSLAHIHRNEYCHEQSTAMTFRCLLGRIKIISD